MSVNMLTVALLSTSQVGRIQAGKRKATNNEDNIVRIRLQAKKETDCPVSDESYAEIADCPKDASLEEEALVPAVNTGDCAAATTADKNNDDDAAVCDGQNKSSSTPESRDEPMKIEPGESLDETKLSIYQLCDKKEESIPEPKHIPPGAIVTYATLSPAEELKMKILTMAHDVQPSDGLGKSESPSEEPWETVLEYFSRIYGFSGRVNFDEGNITLFPDDVNISEEEFVGPFHSPGYLGISTSQMAEGITVTVSAVETINTFYMYDHTSSSQLMALETEMNRWYGYYLWKKVSERMGFVFEIVPGGYYAVYLENLRIWARCFIDEVLPSPRNLFYDPEQRIRAVLFDYEGRLRTFERKQFLPLTRAFISIPVQKTIGKIEAPQEKADFPWKTGDIDVIRQKLEGDQFRAFVSEYDILTEPFAVMTVRLCEAMDSKVDRKQWRRLCEQYGKIRT